MPGRLEGQVAIVTGAAQNIGRAIAMLFAKEGADVVVADLNMEGAQATAVEVQKLGRQALAVKTDVSRSSDVKNLVDQTIKTFNKVDILVNDAAISKSTATLDLSEEEWNAHININLNGTFLCAQAVAKHMIPRRSGKIINIASLAGHRGVPGLAAYCASKGGVLALTRAMAVEWATYNVNVNAVSPGVVTGPMFEAIRQQKPEFLNERMKRVPLHRPNQPEDIAKAVLFLASSDASEVTGQALVVDGGSYALHSGVTPPDAP